MNVADLVCHILIEAGFAGTHRDSNFIFVSANVDGHDAPAYITNILYRCDYLTCDGTRFELSDPNSIDALITKLAALLLKFRRTGR